jgi:threonine/homoserine/homoserine lactone efflux protein
MIVSLAKGTLLGLSAGFAPGPLFALVLSETVRHGTGAGVRVALAPLITDLPIIAVSILLLSRVSHLNSLLGVLTIVGGLFILYLGWENFSVAGTPVQPDTAPARSLWKGVAVNALSPHPYLFWLSVGAPITLAAFERRPLSAALFLGSFYFFLVGSKVLLALITGRSRTFLGGTAYRWTMRVLGLLLCLLALLLLRDGVSLLTAAP